MFKCARKIFFAHFICKLMLKFVTIFVKSVINYKNVELREYIRYNKKITVGIDIEVKCNVTKKKKL